MDKVIPIADSDRPRMFPDGTKPRMFPSSKKRIFPVITEQEQEQQIQQDIENQSEDMNQVPKLKT